MSLDWISDPWVTTISNGKVCNTCRKVISLFDTTEHIFMKDFSVCNCMPCFLLGPSKVLHGTGFAMAMHFHSPHSCCRLMTPLVASPPLLSLSGWFLIFSRWLEKFSLTPVHIGREDRAPRGLRNVWWMSLQQQYTRPAMVQARSSTSEITSSQSASSLGWLVCVRWGGGSQVVLLEAVRGIDCLCTLSSWFLRTSSKLFTIILEVYVGIVFLRWNSGETCLERGPSYFSK